MTKIEFVSLLREKLSGLPQVEVEERLTFYSEIIDDRIEDGLTEEDAVAEIGNLDDVASQIVAEIPLTKLVKEKIKPERTLKIWEIILLVLGSPIWLSLLIAAFAVVLAIYVSVWSVVISLWSVFVSLIASAFGGIIAGMVFIFTASIPTGVAMIGASFICVGLSVFTFYGCKMATKGMAVLTKKVLISIKNLFVKREVA